jgi:hypothetical protein
MEECVFEVSSREEKYSIYGPVLNFVNFEVLVIQIIPFDDGLTLHPNMSKFSTESECKTDTATLKSQRLSYFCKIFALYKLMLKTDC